MSRIFLLSTNRSTLPHAVYPLGMATIAGALAAAGHTVTQFDLLTHADRSLEAALTGFKPDFICLSLRNIDTTDSHSGREGWFLEGIDRVIDRLHRASPAPVILGGAAFSLMPETILEFSGADYGVAGEGEAALVRLLTELVSASPPAPGTIFRPRQALTGEEFARPRHEKEICRFYCRESGIANLQTKRGCPYNCVYCSYPALEGRVFRRRPPITVVDEIEILLQEHAFETLFFVDSVFNEPGGHHLEIAEEILKRGLKFNWSAFFRPTGLKERDLRLMQRAGLGAVELGSDAASDETLAGLGKGFDFADIDNAHKLCLELDLPVAHYIIFGGPDETRQTLEKGLKNLENLDGGVVFIFSGLRIIPGTKLSRLALEEGVISSATSLLRPTYYFSPKIDPTALNREIGLAARRHREWLFPPEEALKRLKIMQRFGFKGLLWDQLLIRLGKQVGKPERT